jgi:hypothetical protein
MKNYISFLLIFVYHFSLLLHWAISSAFPEAKPLCSYADSLELRLMRAHGMPSKEVLTVTAAVAFLLGYQMLSHQALRLRLEFSLLILYPLWLLSNFANYNATLQQLAVSIVLGAALGAYAVVVFHFVLKDYIRALGHVPAFALLLSLTDSAESAAQERGQDSQMLFPTE